MGYGDKGDCKCWLNAGGLWINQIVD